MIGAAVAFRGKTPRGGAVLERSGDGWLLVGETDQSKTLATAGVLELVGTGEFFPLSVDVVPDLAEMLFKEAVQQAEQSLERVHAARTHSESLRDASSDPNPISWVMATSELDRAVRSGITSVVLAIAAAEAQINAWASSLGGWSESEDRLAVGEKCKTLAARVRDPIGLNAPPYQQLHVATKRRNSFLHSMPVPQPVPVTGSRAPAPGLSISLEARSTCLAVRSSFVDLARRLRMTPPAYLAYCPPTRADDDAAWSSATVMTGTRADPDFPPIVSSDS